MFENVDGRTDGRTTDAGVIGILIAHLKAFGSGELKRKSCSLIVVKHLNIFLRLTNQMNSCCRSQQVDSPVL